MADVQNQSASESNTAASPAKKEKKAKTVRAKPSHPPTSEMVNNAIKGLKERNGSSLQAIKKYLAANYKVDPEKIAPFIKKYLKSAVASGALVQKKGKGASGSFKLASVATNTKPAASGVKKPVVKPKKAASPKKEKTEVKKVAKPKTVKKPVAAKPKPAVKAKKPAAATPKKAAVTAAAKAASPAKPKAVSKAKKASKAGPTKKPKAPKPKTAKSPKAKKAAAPKKKK